MEGFPASYLVSKLSLSFANHKRIPCRTRLKYVSLTIRAGLGRC